MWFDNLSSIHFLLKEDNGQSKIPRRKARVWGKREQDEGEASQALAQVQNLRGCKNLRNQDKQQFSATLKKKIKVSAKIFLMTKISTFSKKAGSA